LETLRDLNDRLNGWLHDMEDPILSGPLPTPYYQATQAWQPGPAPSTAAWGSAIPS
jgi:hypothetical protein